MPNKPTVKFNDGEGLDHTDLNAMGTLTDIKCSDYMHYDNLVSGSDAGSTPNYTSPQFSDEVIHCLGGYAGAPRTTATPGQIELFGGVVGQLLDGTQPDETSEHFLKYRLNTGELSHTFSAGDPGLDRYDIVGLNLTQVSGNSVSRDFKDAVTGALTSSVVDKRNYVTASLVTAEGTPGAGFPDYAAIRAALGAGVGAVAVCKMAAGGTTHSVVHDLMRPLGQLHTVWLDLNNYEDVIGSWTMDRGGGGTFTSLRESANDATVRILLSNALPKTARIISVNADITNTVGGTLSLGARDRINAGFNSFDFVNSGALAGSLTNILYHPETNASGTHARGSLWANGAHGRFPIQSRNPLIHVTVSLPNPGSLVEIFGIKIDYLA